MKMLDLAIPPMAPISRGIPAIKPTITTTTMTGESATARFMRTATDTSKAMAIDIPIAMVPITRATA